MLLRELVLHNFGGYKGRQEINLAPPSPRQPVVLFGGLNGSGKTTLLDSLQLALYGKRSRASGRGNLAYETYLRRCVHHGEKGAAVEITFDAQFDGESSSFRVHRSWETVGDGVREHMIVTRNGLESSLLADRWDEIIEELMPLEISSLFFFDGEKIEALADPDRAGRVIATAVNSLLGVNLLERLTADLTALQRRKRSAAADDDTHAQLAELESDVESARARRARALQDQAARRNEMDRSEKGVRKSRACLQRAGGDLFERRGEFERERESAVQRLADLNHDLVEVAGGSLPLRLVHSLLAEMGDQAERERDAKQARLLRTVLAERDAEILKSIGSEIPDDLELRLRELLDSDRQRRAAPAEAPLYLELSTEAEQRLRSLCTDSLQQEADRAKSLLARREQVQDELAEADRSLGAVPDEDAIADALNELRQAEGAMAEARAHYTVASESVEAASREVVQCEVKLERCYQVTSSAILAEEDARRIVDHADRVKSTLAGFREQLLERHIGRIEAAVLDSLQRLLRKRNLVSDLRFERSTFDLVLYDRAGDELAPERLSAGERQLLAVALLWGLARVSGRQLPMVIDTPLGRLDSGHRKLIVERYFPNASAQVILLSTDEEIDETLMDVLRPAIGRSYELRHDDESGATTVADGYFFEEATDVA